jgi:VCBS repeat-containing protein
MGNSISIGNTPQAVDDAYTWTENSLIASGLFDNASNVVRLDVMSNDKGGNAKKLYSIDDESGNFLNDLLTSNVNTGWETTAQGNRIQIVNGQIQLDVSHALALLGASNVNALAAGDVIHDSFNYTIQLGNGTLSWARVTFDLSGSNDGASIAGSASGSVTEDIALTASGVLTVTDADHGQARTVAASGSSAKGTWSVDSTGHWNYTLDNAAAQHLGAADTDSDSFVVTSVDGTASRTVNITIHGTNDPAAIGAPTVSDVTEDSSPTTLTAAGSLSISDIDQAQASFQTTVIAANGNLGSLTLAADGSYSYSVANALVQYLGTGQSKVDTFTVTSLDGTTKDIGFTIHGQNEAVTVSVPVIHGTAQVGQTLTATAAVASPANATVTYQWQSRHASDLGYTSLDDPSAAAATYAAAINNAGQIVGQFRDASGGYLGYL